MVTTFVPVKYLVGDIENCVTRRKFEVQLWSKIEDLTKKKQKKSIVPYTGLLSNSSYPFVPNDYT